MKKLTNKIKKKIVGFYVLVGAFMMRGTVALASKPELKTIEADAVKNDILEGVQWVLGIVVAIGVVGLIACGIAYMVGGEEGHRKAKKGAIGVLIGLAICALAYGLAPTIYGWFDTTATPAA